jgi:hypothetical protein
VSFSDCVTEDDFRQWAAERNTVERAAQGLPPRVEDPGVLARCARILEPIQEAAA